MIGPRFNNTRSPLPPRHPAPPQRVRRAVPPPAPQPVVDSAAFFLKVREENARRHQRRNVLHPGGVLKLGAFLGLLLEGGARLISLIPGVHLVPSFSPLPYLFGTIGLGLLISIVVDTVGAVRNFAANRKFPIPGRLRDAMRSYAFYKAYAGGEVDKFSQGFDRARAYPFGTIVTAGPTIYWFTAENIPAAQRFIAAWKTRFDQLYVGIENAAVEMVTQRKRKSPHLDVLQKNYPSACMVHQGFAGKTSFSICLREFWDFDKREFLIDLGFLQRFEFPLDVVTTLHLLDDIHTIMENIALKNEMARYNRAPRKGAEDVKPVRIKPFDRTLVHSALRLEPLALMQELIRIRDAHAEHLAKVDIGF